MQWLAGLAACFATVACSSDLDLSLAGRPCLNGACVSGYTCVDNACVAASGTNDDSLASADAGQLKFNKDSGAPFFPGTWVGGEARDGGKVALDAAVPPPDRPDAQGGAGGAGGVPASGGTGGVEAGGAGGSGGAPIEPPPACASDARCNNTCVDLLTDPAHCGRCGNACASVERCVDGACEAECVADDPDLVIDIDLDADDDEEEGCPEACDSCTGQTCEIHCDTEQACKERAVDCPEGYACVVSCGATQACEKMTLTCSADRLCSVRCAGEQACKEATIDCAGSHCEMLCVEGKDACDRAQLACGAGPCGATCGEGTKKPMVSRCEQSCSSPACGCM